MARVWLAECSASHKACRNQKQHRRPTRLVSVGHNAVRLVITESLQSPPQYATLSYCWGRIPFLKLARSNLDAFMDRIPQNNLPQTFNDAITVARKLKIEYVWIDALCIIQDDDASENDWAKEAGHMSSVYGGAFVNLAATTALSVHEGFLQRPRSHGGFVAEVTTTESSRVQCFHSVRVFEKAVTNTHLAGRAWAFQERLLPARTIFFGDTGLFWTCRYRCCSEFLPEGLGSRWFKGSCGICDISFPFRRWDPVVYNHNQIR